MNESKLTVHRALIYIGGDLSCPWEPGPNSRILVWTNISGPMTHEIRPEYAPGMLFCELAGEDISIEDLERLTMLDRKEIERGILAACSRSSS